MTNLELRFQCTKLAVELIGLSKSSNCGLSSPAEEVKIIADDLYEYIVCDKASTKQSEREA